MKKLICLLLAALFLAGCANTAQSQLPAITRDYTPDYRVTPTQEPEDPEEILAYRRQLVVEEMREMMSVLWTPTETFAYDIQEDPENPQPYTFEKGKIYSGIPYATGCGAGYSFLSYAVGEENGVYTLDGLSGENMSGKQTPRIGNTCSSSIAWAWGRVSNSINFSLTKFMTPMYGCLKVGDYVYEGSNYDDVRTSKVCEDNGKEVMFAAYAQMQPGDAMVRRVSDAGHAIMVVDVNVVYDGEGRINSKMSTATIVDQSGTYIGKPETTYIEGVGAVILCEKLDKVRTFDSLFKSGYLPITCKELVDPSPRAEVTLTDYTDTPTVDNMFKGVLKSSYRIAYVTVDIYSGDNLVQTATCYSQFKEMYDFNLYRFTESKEQPAIRGSVDIDALPAGAYRCVFTARMSTGDEITFRDFTFQK